MNTESSSQLNQTQSYLPGTQRTRITTIDLMRGSRQVVLVHGGEEYILRITKTGKLILTK